MDYLGNAELWSIDGKPRLLNVWFLIMDVGSSWNEIFCMDKNGRVLTQELLNVYEPVDGTGGSWRHLAIESYPTTGGPQILTSKYLDNSGNPVAAPKLDKDNLAEANRAFSPGLAKEIIARIARKTQ
jgi:hypothetical protein